MSVRRPARITAWPDSTPGIEDLLVPGAAVALVPGREGAGLADGWLRSCGKTQLAACLAEGLWQSRGIELLACSASPRRSPGSQAADSPAGRSSARWLRWTSCAGSR